MNNHQLNYEQAPASDGTSTLERQAELAMSNKVLYIASSKDERQLFCRIAQGDELAFRQLFNLYAPLFSAIIKKILKDDTATEDLLQDVFLKIWLKRASLEQIERPRAWAMQIVYHIAFNRLRHLKVVSKADAYVSLQENKTASNEVEEVVLLAETSNLIQKAVDNLPSQTRKIYVLNREEGLKIAEIAQQLNLSTQTVKNTLGKAIREIKKYLIREGTINV